MRRSFAAASILSMFSLLLSLSPGPLAGEKENTVFTSFSNDALALYPDPTSDINWSAGYSGVADIQSAFNNGRAQENSQLGTSVPSLTMPSQSSWDGMDDNEKAEFLINQERSARGIMELEGSETNVAAVAQAYAQYCISNDCWGHYCGGTNPTTRLLANGAISACHDGTPGIENMAAFLQSGPSVSLPISRAIYMWMYDDSISSWGHRHNLLYEGYVNNACSPSRAGFFGIGRASGGPYQSWAWGEVVVYDTFDPCSSWQNCEPTPSRLVISSGDYNNDNYDDIAIFRPSSGLWSIRGVTRVYFGGSSDTPVPGDYNNDGRTDIGVFRSSSGLWAVRGLTRVYYGSSSDTPVPGDYNADNRCDIGIFRPSSGLWAVRYRTRTYYGSSSDLPVPGDYNNNNRADIAVFRESSGLWSVKGFTRVYFGGSGDEPVPMDYANNGYVRPAIFRPSSGMWAIRGLTRIYFGGSSDQPVPADYYGGWADEVAVFRSSNGLWAVRGYSRIYYGTSGDIPVTR